MRTGDLEAALASLKASVTERRAVSVEWLVLKPEWSLSRSLFCVRTRTLTKSSHQLWKNKYFLERFHTSSFGVQLGFIDVRFLLVWMM